MLTGVSLPETAVEYLDSIVLSIPCIYRQVIDTNSLFPTTETVADSALVRMGYPGQPLQRKRVVRANGEPVFLASHRQKTCGHSLGNASGVQSVCFVSLYVRTLVVRITVYVGTCEKLN